MSVRAENRTRDITTEPIGPLLARLTVPMVLGIIATVSLGLADSWFISLLGTDELAAISFINPVYMIFMGMALGIGMGVNAVVSRLSGEGNHDEAARYVTDSLILVLLASVVIAVLTGFFIMGVFSSMGATDIVLPHIRSYMDVLVYAMPTLMITFVGANTLRAAGDVKMAGALPMLLSLLNLVLDPLFIFGVGPFPEQGVQGAATATAVASVISCVTALYLLVFREKLLVFSGLRRNVLKENWRKLLQVALPAAVANILLPIEVAFMTVMVAFHGPESVAGYGVGNRLEGLCLLIMYALSMTLPMFIGQNLGAGRPDRAFQGLFGALKFMFAFQILVYLLLLVLASRIAGAFGDNPEVAEVIRLFIYIIPLTYGAQALVTLVAVSLNVLKRPGLALLLMVVWLLVLYLPLAFIGRQFWGVTGLFSGAATGNVIAAALACLIIRKVCSSGNYSPPSH